MCHEDLCQCHSLPCFHHVSGSDRVYICSINNQLSSLDKANAYSPRLRLTIAKPQVRYPRVGVQIAALLDSGGSNGVGRMIKVQANGA